MQLRRLHPTPVAPPFAPASGCISSFSPAFPIRSSICSRLARLPAACEGHSGSGTRGRDARERVFRRRWRRRRRAKLLFLLSCCPVAQTAPPGKSQRRNKTKDVPLRVQRRQRAGNEDPGERRRGSPKGEKKSEQQQQQKHPSTPTTSSFSSSSSAETTRGGRESGRPLLDFPSFLFRVGGETRRLHSSLSRLALPLLSTPFVQRHQ